MIPILKNRLVVSVILTIIFVFLLIVNILPIFLNDIATSLLHQQIQAVFGDKLTIGKVTVSLWRGAEIGINQIHLTQPPGYGNGDLLLANEVTVRFELLPLLRHQLIIRGITIYDPEMNIIQLADGRMNTDYYLNLLNNASDPKQPTQNLLLNRFEIKNANLVLNSKALSRVQPTLELYNCNFLLHHLILPNPSLSPADFRFTGLIKSSHPAKVDLKGQGVFLPNDISFTAHSRVSEFPLPEFSYLYQSPDFNILSGTAWVTSTINCKHNYFYSQNHADVQNLRISGQKGHLGGQLLFGLPANLFLKIIQDKHGLLQLDFVVEGPLSNIQAHTGTLVSSAISNAVRSKFGGIKSLGSTATTGIKTLGNKTKNAFKKLFGK